MYVNIIKFWLTLVLCFLPFQRNIVKNIRGWNSGLSTLLSYMDEITILILFIAAVTLLYKERKLLSSINLALLIPIISFSLAGLVSGMVNGNSLFITSIGTIDYIKNFLVIFIYAAFFRDIGEVRRILKLVLMIAVALGAVALIQESWALVFRYGFEENIPDLFYVFESSWGDERYGVYRVSSLMHHPNMLGLYSLLVLVMYINTAKKVNFGVIFFLLTGALVSMSRMVYSGLIITMGIHILKGRKWVVLILVPVLISAFIFSSQGDIDLSQKIKEQYNQDPSMVQMANTITYREYARDKAMNIWKDHPFLGVGPGMFGGPISIKYHSPVYEEYNSNFIVTWFRSLDQFWPQVLAEAGIVGTAGFALIFINLFIILVILLRRTDNDEIKSLLMGVTIFLIVILIYLMGSGLNLTSVLFTYFAFVGMALGCESSSRKSCEEIK